MTVPITLVSAAAPMGRIDPMAEIPFAMFRFNGATVTMTQAQFEQARRDARLCRCHACLCCRAAEYWHETTRTKPED